MSEAWEKDKVTIKFVNLENRGGTHVFSVNGRTFQLEDGKIYTVPRAVVEALKDAVYTKWKIEGHMDKETTATKVIEERFFTSEVAAPDVPEKATAKKAAVAAAAGELRGRNPKPLNAQLDDAINDVVGEE